MDEENIKRCVKPWLMGLMEKCSAEPIQGAGNKTGGYVWVPNAWGPQPGDGTPEEKIPTNKWLKFVAFSAKHNPNAGKSIFSGDKA